MFWDNITIGADPEFTLLDSNGRVVAAPEAGISSYEAHLGVDGGGVVAELRPQHDIEPIRVARNIQSALETGLRRNQGLARYTWKAGCCANRYPTGGHIHFGGMTTCGHYTRDGRDWWNPNMVMKELDTYLAQTVLLLCPKDEFRGRVRGSYGSLTEYRGQNWGVEYRTLGSWVTSPLVAASVLTLAKVIFCDGLEKAYRNTRGLFYNEDAWAGADAYYQADIGYVRKMVYPNIRRDIMNMAEYRRHSKVVSTIFRMVEGKVTWQPASGDMKTAWRLTLPQPARPIGAVTTSALWRR